MSGKAWAGLAAIAVSLAILVGLGIWQVHRNAWKADLQADLQARFDQTPRPLAEVLEEAGGDLRFHRVRVSGTFLPETPTIRLYTTRGGDPGSRVHTLFESDGGRRFFVDRGFQHGLPERAAPPPPAPEGTVTLEGVLRDSAEPGWLVPEPDREAGVVYVRDLPVMADMAGAEKATTNVLLVQDPDPNPADRLIADAQLELTDRHLSYALTWFGLAGCLIGVAAAYIVKQRRRS